MNHLWFQSHLPYELFYSKHFCRIWPPMDTILSVPNMLNHGWSKCCKFWAQQAGRPYWNFRNQRFIPLQYDEVIWIISTLFCLHIRQRMSMYSSIEERFRKNSVCSSDHYFFHSTSPFISCYFV